eukprot:1227790-Lingulodinium_polyedra.AAC.1
MRSNRPCAIVTARKSHSRALHAHNNFCCMHETNERAICGGGRSVGSASVLFGCCSGAAWCCLAAAWVVLEC